MNKEIGKQLFQVYFSKEQTKINRNEKLVEFFYSFSKFDLKKVLGGYILQKDEVELLSLVPFDDKCTKKEMVDYLLLHFEEIYQTDFSSVHWSFIEQYRRLVAQQGFINLDLNDTENPDYSIAFLDHLLRHKMAKMNYQEKEGYLEVFMPQEILMVIKKCLKNSKMMRKVKENNKITDAVISILCAYGILPFSKLREILQTEFFQVSEERLKEVVLLSTIDDGNLRVYEYEEELLVSNHSFSDEDEAFTFYASLSIEDYKIFTRQDYEKMYEEIYHHQFGCYQELMEFLFDVMNFSLEEIEQFENIFVMDYLYTFQLDEELANRNFMTKLSQDFPGLNLKEKVFLKRTIKKIAQFYPNYHLKGRAILEKDLDENLIKN